MTHNINGFCIDDLSQQELDVIIEMVCFKHNTIDICKDMCYTCIIAYVNKNMKKINDAVENKNIYTVNFMIFYHERILIKNNDKINKYKNYLKIIKNNDLNAMSDLGFYYQNIEKNYELMYKYYVMAIKRGHLYAMYNLGYYYQYVEHNYEQMEKSYLLFIESANPKHELMSDILDSLIGKYKPKTYNRSPLELYNIVTNNKCIINYCVDNCDVLGISALNVIIASEKYDENDINKILMKISS